MARRDAFLRAALLLLAAGAAAPSALADRVILKKGSPLRGTVTRTDTDTAVNKFRSRVAAMTYGVTRVPNDQVKRVDEEIVPEEVIRKKRADLKPDDAAGHLGLAKYGLSQKVKLETQRLLEETLALDPANADALELYGGKSKFDAVKRGNPALDADLAKDLAAYLAIADGATRAREAKRIETARGFPAKADVLERMWKSAKEAKGLREDVPLTLRADKNPGGKYTIFVPDSYDPRIATPLVFGLHGGGAGGKDGNAVVGSGKDAATFYVQECTRAGWILVCPTALEAPWSAPKNEPYLMALLEEVEARFNIDLDRVYLTGHSMGGFGTWWFGPRHVDSFAAIAPAAGGGGGGFKEMKTAGTAIYIYHSADDPVVGVGSDQQAAAQLLDMGADVVYLQLENRGHSYPTEAIEEMFDIFQVKRLADAKRASDWPRSSFSRKPTPDESKYLGDPAAAWGSSAAAPETMKSLIAELERGGGGAEKAAESIAASKPEGAAKAVAKVLRATATLDDVRAWAARCLGDLADPAGVAALSETVAEPRPGRVVREAAIALRKLADPAASDALAKAMGAWAQAFDKKLQGSQIEFPDWEEVCSTLAEIVEAYGVCAPPAPAPAVIEKFAVKGVLGRPVEVQALARAGQDASRPRSRLAEAIGRAFATLRAPDAFAQGLLAVCSSDRVALEAAERGKTSPYTRAGLLK